MLGRGKGARTLGEHQIFGDEEAAQMAASIEELKAQVADLNARVHSQFTTIAAHAEIARQQAEFVREEARADLDRTRDTIIGLVEQVRADAVAVVTPGDAADATWPAPDGPAPLPAPAVADPRVEAIERQLESIGAAVERCFERQRELANTMEAMLDTVLAVQMQQPMPTAEDEAPELDESTYSRASQLAIALT